MPTVQLPSLAGGFSVRTQCVNVGFLKHAAMATWVLSVPCASSPRQQNLSFSHLLFKRRGAKWRSAQGHISHCALFASSPIASPYTSHCALFASSPIASPYTATSLSDPHSTDEAPHRPPPGFSVVEEFYACVNRRDFDSVRDLIAEDCIYDDLIFPQPFVGRTAIVEFFSKFTGAVGSDLQFVIDDISKDDPFCVGVTWHLEWSGKSFPFSKGCSFYRLTTSHGKQQIVYARDSVEPVVKPGDSTLVIIRAVAGLLKRFPQLADRF